jgi:cytochrome c oxidase cbb3-type subunit 1
MWVSGIMEGLMWREYTPQGFLAYSFIETVSAKHIENVIRAIGGLMFLSGALIMIVNIWKTIASPELDLAAAEQTDDTPAVPATANA